MRNERFVTPTLGIALLLIFGCTSESMGDSAVDFFLETSADSNCYPEALFATFAGQQKLSIRSAGLRREGDRTETNIMLLAGDQLVLSALSNPLVRPPEVKGSNVLIVQFIVRPNANATDVIAANALATKFRAWTVQYMPECWRIAAVRENVLPKR